MFNKSCLQSYGFWKHLVLCLIGLELVYLHYSGLSLHQLFNSPFHYKGLDPSYWLMESIGLPLIFKTFYGIVAFEIALFLSLLLAIVQAQKTIWTIVFGLLLLSYQLLFNYKLGYHTHHLFGLQFALFPFYFKQNKALLTFNFSRFMVCMTYFMAGVFKVFGGAYLQSDNLVNTLQSQHAAYWYFYPNSLRIQVLEWCMQHVGFSHAVFVLAILLQLAFVIGFFTKRCDKLLAVFLLVFHLMDWLLMNLGIFMGMCIMAYLFVMPRDLTDFSSTKKT